jgi:hypothetical protein
MSFELDAPITGGGEIANLSSPAANLRRFNLLSLTVIGGGGGGRCQL